jgi:hypothetical protein
MVMPLILRCQDNPHDLAFQIERTWLRISVMVILRYL